MGKVLEDRLSEMSLAEAADAAKIVRLVNESIVMTRDLARGLLPMASESGGLLSALDLWARQISEIFHITCRFECTAPVPIHDDALADHLYHLAQESVNNAIKHGRARKIIIGLSASHGSGMLSISDDGAGFVPLAGRKTGLGLRIMHYRAKMIGGSLEMHSSPESGTIVRCVFPIRESEMEGHDVR
jgi:signal transduction histidine kinase